MNTLLLDGKDLAAKIKRKLSNHVSSLTKNHGLVPTLAIIRVGENPASKLYVTSKCRQCEEVGIQAHEYYLPPTIPREDVIDLIYRLNADINTHGILVQLPLPDHLDSLDILSTLDPFKDVDGLNPLNLGKLIAGDPFHVPCTPKGCLTLLKEHYKDLTGMKAVIVGRSILVGKPLGMLLLNENCTVSYTHTKTKNITEETRQADILIAAAGIPKLVTKNWVKPGAIVIDVGINYLIHPDGSSDLVGDVDFHVVKEIARAITPVPGGIGPMTVVSLLQNTVAALLHQSRLQTSS